MPREALIAELKRLSHRELQLTLVELGSNERGHVLALIREAKAEQATIPPFETLVGLSPWLLKAIDRGKAASSAARSPFTPATRSALAKALEQLASAKTPSMAGGTKQQSGLARIFRTRRLRKRAA